MTATQLKNGVRAWHEELLEYIIANPRATGAQTALFFNVSESWLSIVKNSDAFRELWAQRRPEHFSRVSASVHERVTALAEVSVSALTDQLEKEVRSGTATQTALRETAELALRSLGFGMKKESVGAPLNVQINAQNNSSHTQNTTIVVDRDTLARARETKAKLQQTIQIEKIEDQTKEKE